MTKMQKKLFAIVIVLFIVVLNMLVGVQIAKNEPNQLKVRYQTLSSSKIPESMKDVSILYFTDLQFGKFETQDRAKKVFEQIKELDPDIVIFGGDLIDENYDLSQKNMAFLIKYLSKIKAPLGKFCVLGEKDADTAKTIYNQSEFEILDNKTIKLFNHTKEYISLTSLSENTKEYSFMPTSSDTYNLLVTHMPDNLNADELLNYPIDFALCGHSHGTQVTAPILGAYRSVDGAKEINRNKQKKLSFSYIISSGIGCTHVNLRLKSTPEIYYFTLQHKD